MFFFGTEFVDGVNMSKLSEEEKLVVTQELIKHVAKLKKLGSNKPGFRVRSIFAHPTQSTPCFGNTTAAGGQKAMLREILSFVTTTCASTIFVLTPKPLKL